MHNQPHCRDSITAQTTCCCCYIWQSFIDGLVTSCQAVRKLLQHQHTALGTIWTHCMLNILSRSHLRLTVLASNL